MAETEIPIESTASRRSPARRILPRQACDSCRNRKTRCEQSATQDDDLSSTGTKGTRGSRILDSSTPCKRCTRLGLECTSILPVRSRGPQPRNKLDKTPKPSSSATSNARNEGPPASPISGYSLGSPVDSQLQLGSPQSQEAQAPQTPFHLPRSPLSNQHWSASPHSSSLYEQLEATAAYPTGIVCGRGLLADILNDYFDYLYPLVPIVHRPSFLQAFSNQRDLYDKDLLCLTYALCAVTVAALPSKFQKYQRSEEPPRYANPKEMIYACYDTTQHLRGRDYFDTINYQKWAVSHLMYLSFFHVAEYNRSRMIEVEAMQLARLLDLHKVSGYDGLNCIEKQLRKKAFWLTFHGHVHGQLQFLRRERLRFLDHAEVRNLQFEALMPDEVDDEYILEHAVLPQPPGKLSLVVGFNLNARVFQAALTSTMPQRAQASNEPCYCSRAEGYSFEVQQLKERLCELRYMLDDIPTQMRPWAVFEEAGSSATASENIVHGQFASMRANIHTSQLWFQSLVLDQLDALVETETARGSALPLSIVSDHNSKSAWKEREDLCRQLLHLLHGIPEVYLEPNGNALVCKIRDVAVTLLVCPADLDEGAHRRAAAYLQDFSVILSKLDGSECTGTVSLQSWVDTDRRHRL